MSDRRASHRPTHPGHEVLKLEDRQQRKAIWGRDWVVLDRDSSVFHRTIWRRNSARPTPRPVNQLTDGGKQCSEPDPSPSRALRVAAAPKRTFGIDRAGHVDSGG